MSVSLHCYPLRFPKHNFYIDTYTCISSIVVFLQIEVNDNKKRKDTTCTHSLVLATVHLPNKLIRLRYQSVSESISLLMSKGFD